MESSNPGRETVEQLAEEFIERYRRGEQVQPSEYEALYPHHAAEIHDLFPALVVLERVAPKSESAAGTMAEKVPLRDRCLEELERLGDYRILREIGRGGMGVVYEAEQVSLGRHVAVKVLTQTAMLDSRRRKRFEREAKAAAKLHHTNIVPVFGVGEERRVCYYVMQFIRGLGLDDVIDELPRLLNDNGSLRSERLATAIAYSLVAGEFPAPVEGSEFGDLNGHAADRHAVEWEPAANEADTTFGAASRLLDALSPSSSSPWSTRSEKDSSVGRLPTYWQSAANIGVQVAEALHYAHELGVLHRDIKPSNLLLDQQGVVWVTDFGLAKADSDGDNLTATGDIIGTLRYMSPERFNGQADPRSDVYSLGLTLYELLTLRPAFNESDRSSLIRQLMHDEPVPPRVLNPAVPRDLETVVLKAIARAPADRYQTAGKLAEDLQRFLRDEPIHARRATSLERLARWSRHHPGVSTLLGVIALLLLAVSIGSSIAAVQFRRLAGDRESARIAAAADRDKAKRSAEEARQRGAAERWQRYRSNIAAAGSALQLEHSGARGSPSKAHHRNTADGNGTTSTTNSTEPAWWCPCRRR